MSTAVAEIATLVAADFAGRSIAADVLFGDWKKAEHNAGNRVVIGVSTEFEDADLGPANTPGPQLLEEAESDARTLFTMAEYADVTVHVAPVGEEADPDRQKKTHKALLVLVRQTIRAMYLAAPGAFGWGRGAVLKPEASEFRYGAAATFRAQFLTPVLDDPRHVIVPTGYSGETVATMPNEGDVVVGTSAYTTP